MSDWSVGCYEETAVEIAPVSRHVIDLAVPGPGETVVDLACGTGNAALLAAAGGATVTGLDAAPRLIEVARARSAEEGVEAKFVLGDLQELPFEDASFDVGLSVFGLIFAPDPRQGFDELVRVLRPGARAFVSVWVPAGPIHRMVAAFVDAMPGPGRSPFPWHDPDAVGDLAAAHRLEVRFHDGRLEIADDSPEAYLTRQGDAHPLSCAMRPVLERAGTYEEARERALAALHAGNEEPGGFRVSSPYRVIELRKPS